MNIFEKLTKWLFFSVAVALLPLSFHYLQLVMVGRSPGLADITQHGELLIISAAMAAAAIGDVVSAEVSRSILKMMAIGFCVIMLLLSSLLYAFISSCTMTGVDVKSHIASNISIITYVFTLITSASSIAITEVN